MSNIDKLTTYTSLIALNVLLTLMLAGIIV